MDIRIKEKLKNQQGSSLAFVLIIGMVIMIMVASLLAVANSDFTFAQETLESRQAYIDAKSVIEFGKIEINERMTALSNKNAELESYYNDYKNGDHSALLEQKIKTAKNERDILVAALANQFIIYGNPDNVTGTLTAAAPDAVNAAKIVKLGVLTYDAGKKQFTIETQGLRRKLDYQADFNYMPTTSTPVTPGTPGVIPGIPSGNWCTTQIKANKGNGKIPVSCVITSGGGGGNTDKYNSDTKTLEVKAKTSNLAVGKENGNPEKFDWKNEQILDLTARNINVVVPLPQVNVADAEFHMTALDDEGNLGQIRFEKDYHQVNGDINTLSAYNVVIIGDLIIDAESYLEINCANLWVTGDIVIKTNDPNRINVISATNIIVNGKIEVSANSKAQWTYDKFYLNGQITIGPNSGNSGGGSVVVTPGSTGLIKDLYY